MRQFRGHTDRITDLHMSADARWLLSASLDGTVRAWDVPSSMCLQASSAALHDYLPQNSCLPHLLLEGDKFERVAAKRRAPKATRICLEWKMNFPCMLLSKPLPNGCLQIHAPYPISCLCCQ